MDWVETTGRTLEEAKKLALEQLGVEEADAEFDIISEPRVGLFGRLKEEARVRARVQPRYPRSKGERRDRRRSRPSSGADQAARAQSPVPAGGADGGTDKGREAERQDADDSQLRPAVQAGARRKRRTGGSTAMTDQPAQDTARNEDARASAEQQARLAEDFLRGLLAQLGAAATVSSSRDDMGTIEVLVTGDELGTLIGPKGATLLALQELTRIVVQRHSAPSDSRVVVDINGYRHRRQEALTRFVQQVAAEVRSTKARRALEPMPPADRKIVHDAVNAIEGVTTISQGEEPYRRVVLVPEDAGASAQLSGEDGGGGSGEDGGSDR